MRKVIVSSSSSSRVSSSLLLSLDDLSSPAGAEFASISSRPPCGEATVFLVVGSRIGVAVRFGPRWDWVYRSEASEVNGESILSFSPPSGMSLLPLSFLYTLVSLTFKMTPKESREEDICNP